jgi:hypothetical protein
MGKIALRASVLVATYWGDKWEAIVLKRTIDGSEYKVGWPAFLPMFTKWVPRHRLTPIEVGDAQEKANPQGEVRQD